VGFEVDPTFSVSHEKTDRRERHNIIKSQVPAGSTVQHEGAAVNLVCWQFDPHTAADRADCSHLEGGVGRYDDDTGRAVCSCPEGQVELESGTRGRYCSPCDQVRFLFDYEIARENADGAKRFLDVSRDCLWHSDGLRILGERSRRPSPQAPTQADPQAQASAWCQDQLPGSRPTFVSDTRYRCDCPQGARLPAGGGRLRCGSCPELLELVNKAGYSGDVASLQHLVPLGENCRWYASAAQQTNQMAQNQVAANQARCQQLRQQVDQACRAGLQPQVSLLITRSQTIPDCFIDPMLASRCGRAPKLGWAAPPGAMRPPGGSVPSSPPGQGAGNCTALLNQMVSACRQPGQDALSNNALFNTLSSQYLNQGCSYQTAKARLQGLPCVEVDFSKIMDMPNLNDVVKVPKR
jgi:hypothetical protein